MSIHADVLSAIGHTPIVKLGKVVPRDAATVLVKLEYMNPGGSIKDRMAIHILEKAEKAGLLRKGGTIVENTSGNTGVGLAVAAAVKGYRCIFTMPDKMSKEKQDTLKAFGAQVVVTPTNVPADSPESYYSVAKRIAAETPNSFYVNQYHNADNVEAHYRSTAPEIWEQTGGKFDAFVAGIGTGGTMSGCGRFFKEKDAAHPQRGRRPGGLRLPLDVEDREAVRAPRLQGGGHRRGHDVRGHGSRPSSTTSARSPTPRPSPWPAAWPARRGSSPGAARAPRSTWPCSWRRRWGRAR